MEYILLLVTLMSHLIFIMLVHRLLISLFDWSKVIKPSEQATGQLRIFLILLSIAVGYLVSHFVLDIITLLQTALLGTL
ncbi:DUF1146 family protein [Streptococcus sp. zg-JUN1979]|uniref:DUF1146 family protein n=1 Tax=Streptococcus sp. zg-JUN1979 TaxID=3391450 RepID=UPI0039A4F5DD